MKLKDVVARLKQIRDQKPNTVNHRKEALVFDADRLSFLKFNYLIERFQAEGEREFCEDDRVLLKDFLIERWNGLVGRTHADYFMNPYGRAAKVFRDLAKFTAIELFSETADHGRPSDAKREPWLSLMVPTLNESMAKNCSNENFKFRDYQLSSDMTELHHVGSTLNLNSKTIKNKQENPIEQSVLGRVSNHDEYATKLAAIKSVPQRNRAQVQNTLNQRMRNEEKAVTATYHPERNDYLQQMIKDQWVSLGVCLAQQLSEQPMPTLDGLLMHIAVRLPHDLKLAPDLLSAFVYRLKDGVLDTLLKADKVDRELTNSVKNRVFMYLSLANYVLERTKQGEYKSSFGRCSKQDKLKVANSILEKLATGVPLAEIANYLKSDDLTDNEKNVVVNGNLGALLRGFFLENAALNKPVELEEGSGYFAGMATYVLGRAYDVVSYAGSVVGLFPKPSSQPQPAPDFGKEAVHRPT